MVKLIRRAALAASFSLLMPMSAFAANDYGIDASELAVNATAHQSAPKEKKESLWERFKRNTAATWNSPDYYDLYIPVITRHMRFAYDQEKIDSYNERPWGGGLGMSRFDADGDWHGLYAMAFKDSHNQWEPFFGYGFEKIWRPFEAVPDFRIGGGFTAGITMREDWHWIPVPAPLPIVSVGYKRFIFQMAYIPGTYNNGNVFFAWTRILI